MTALPRLAERIVGLIHSLSDKGGLTVEITQSDSDGGRLIALTRDARVLRYSPQLPYSPRVSLYFVPDGALGLTYINDEAKGYHVYSQRGGLVRLAELVRVFNVLVSTNFTFRITSVDGSSVQAEMYGTGYPYHNKPCAIIIADQERGAVIDIQPLV